MISSDVSVSPSWPFLNCFIQKKVKGYLDWTKMQLNGEFWSDLWWCICGSGNGLKFSNKWQLDEAWFCDMFHLFCHFKTLGVNRGAMNTIISHNASQLRNWETICCTPFQVCPLRQSVSHIIVLICQCMLLTPFLSKGDIFSLFSFIGTTIELIKLQWYQVRNDSFWCWQGVCRTQQPTAWV